MTVYKFDTLREYYPTTIDETIKKGHRETPTQRYLYAMCALSRIDVSCLRSFPYRVHGAGIDESRNSNVIALIYVGPKP